MNDEDARASVVVLVSRLGSDAGLHRRLTDIWCGQTTYAVLYIDSSMSANDRAMSSSCFPSFCSQLQVGRAES